MINLALRFRVLVQSYKEKCSEFTTCWFSTISSKFEHETQIKKIVLFGILIFFLRGKNNL